MMPARREDAPAVGQINLVVGDMAASVAFWRGLGLDIVEARAPGWERHHATAIMANGFRLELDSAVFAGCWCPGTPTRAERGGAVIFVTVAEREQVDALLARMAARGSPVRKAAEDAFWGARYALIEDPDGNAVGIMSPIDPARRRAPPTPPGGRL
jgi:catechol 2,3-dioxygenase-like lactoylglutathione lyase family enzyme